MNAITADPHLVAYCGLYCEACRAYRRGRCPGCRDNTRLTWCRVRACCIEQGCETCAGCHIVDDPADCRRYNNLVARLFGVVMNSDRCACIAEIQRLGTAAYATEMARRGSQSLPRRGGGPLCVP